jgi:hypothetical protein
MTRAGRLCARAQRCSFRSSYGSTADQRFTPTRAVIPGFPPLDVLRKSLMRVLELFDVRYGASHGLCMLRVPHLPSAVDRGQNRIQGVT